MPVGISLPIEAVQLAGDIGRLRDCCPTVNLTVMHALRALSRRMRAQAVGLCLPGAVRVGALHA